VVLFLPLYSLGLRLALPVGTLKALVFIYLFVCLFIDCMGGDLRAAHLLGRSFYLSHTSGPFGLIVTEIGSHFFPRPAWTFVFLFTLSAPTGVADCVLPCLSIGQDGVLQSFCPV
jgi:hypothetical protein